jgi:tyrosine-protein phosphatase
MPNGGMRLPPLRPLKTNPHGFAEVPIEQEEEDQEPNFDIPQSREEKPAAYPNGPICIYESGVYLYFEPTAEQATSFDVIFNVASEVKNPFTSPEPDSEKDLDARRVDGPPAENVDFATIPQKATPLDNQSSSPTTPKATPLLQTVLPGEQVINGASLKRPEYIHMPWEHNTDIVPDLYKLVKIMDDRVKQGKRVLVHCQCGVSRSASLIVAYGLYKNPGISVQEAYDAVKKRSKWIGPNMNLIMQLQEFRNGLIRANESRTHNQGFGFPRRSAGLSTGVSNGTNRNDPFDRESQPGSRTPRTAPLPPESDITLQRASTGNMMAISPGPLSAPSGVTFSPEFRRSWAPSQTRFDLSPKTSPTAMPYVDPKGHVIPMLSITDNDRSSTQPSSHSSGGFAATDQLEDLKTAPVPNFSRQLPFRTQFASGPAQDGHGDTNTEVSLAAPPQSAGLGALRSPLAASFNIPPLAPIERTNGVGRFPPKPMGFNVAPWSRGSDGTTSLSTRVDDQEAHEPPMSPRSTEFHLTGLNPHKTEDSFGLLSPRATSFNLGPEREDDDFEVTSPTATEFPKDPFARAGDAFDIQITSPRGTEFHMAPLKPNDADQDPFGLTSPTRFEFPRNPFGPRDSTGPLAVEPEERRPSFQAILPPSHLAQPEAVNGFASLNSTAQPQTVSHPKANAQNESLSPSNKPSSPAALTMSSQPQTTPSAEFTTQDAPRSVMPALQPPKAPEHSFLSTPPRPGVIRTRFSSPNMREQRRLHKLQTEMEALLPSRSPHPPQAQDDLDALMSPRAEEFTRNPFHFEVPSSVDDTSPASSVETIKNGHSGADWKESQHLTPQKVADPRSPVQAGSSPIVRNIWDVL